MSIGWIMGGFFCFVTLLFVAIAFFLPEWVGITGKKAKQIMKEQQGASHSVSTNHSMNDAASSSADSKTSKP